VFCSQKGLKDVHTTIYSNEYKMVFLASLSLGHLFHKVPILSTIRIKEKELRIMLLNLYGQKVSIISNNSLKLLLFNISIIRLKKKFSFINFSASNILGICTIKI
jgi:hypothetical protein